MLKFTFLVRRVFLGPLTLIPMAVLLACLISPILQAAQTSPSQSPELSLTEYEAEVDRLSPAISELIDRPAGIGALRDSLPANWVVDTGGQQVSVSTKWLSDALTRMEKEPVERKRLCLGAIQRLQFLKAEAEEFRAKAAGSADARGKLNSILSGREFQDIQQETWLGQLWRQIQRWIDWLLEHTIGRLLHEGPIRTVVVWLLIGLVFAVVAVWLVRVLGRAARTEALRAETLFTPGKTWRDWVREAQAAASKGDFRAAVFLSYWAGVYKLADLGIWQLDRARTPREYLHLLDKRAGSSKSIAGDLRHEDKAIPPAGSAAALGDLTRSMEAVWYGFTPATQREYDVAFQNLEKLGCRLHSTPQTANS